MQDEKGIPARLVSAERYELSDFSEAGQCGPEFRGKITTVLEQLDGEPLLVVIRKLDAGENHRAADQAWTERGERPLGGFATAA